MASAIEQARKFEDLLEMDADGPYVFTQMFSNENRSARSRSKRTFKLLKSIDAPLRKMLREDEHVFFVTRGIAQPSILEWYFLGAPLYYMNQRAIILTSHRVLLLQINSRHKPKEMRNEISYAAVKRVKNSWTGTTKVEFHNGGKVLLTGIPKADRKYMQETFDRLLPRIEAPHEQSQLEHLCPHCYARVTGHPTACPSCGGAFKSPRVAALLSLVYPGAGDLYLGHSGFAVLELIGSTVVWGAVVAFGFAPDIGLLETVIMAAFLLVFMHGADAFTTRMIARKGIIPDSGKSPATRFALASVVPVLAIASIALMAPSKAELRPEAGIVAGSELSEAHRDALEDAGYLEPGESVRYFFSLGPSTILQDGSLFTDERIVSYESTMDETFHQAARYEDVVELRVEPQAPGADITQVWVVTESDGVFLLFIGTEGNGDDVFVKELEDRWRAVRASGPGIWFEGGGGTADDAILVHGLDGGSSLDDAATWWLGVWLGEPKVDWTLSRRVEHERSVEYQVDRPGQGSSTFFFAPTA